ncbi:unnamed protein product [Camellia sinensis]
MLRRHRHLHWRDEDWKTERYKEIIRSGTVEPRPGVLRLMDEAKDAAGSGMRHGWQAFSTNLATEFFVKQSPTNHSPLLRGQVIAKPGSVKTYKRFEAEIYVLTKDEGGRHTAFFSNYRPQFYMRTADITGKVELPENVKMVMPGDNVTAIFELISPVPLDAAEQDRNEAEALERELHSKDDASISLPARQECWREGGFSHDIPTTLHRSKVDCPVPEEMVTVSVDGSVVDRIAKIMSYLRLGSSGNVLKKKKKEREVKGRIAIIGNEYVEDERVSKPNGEILKNRTYRENLPPPPPPPKQGHPDSKENQGPEVSRAEDDDIFVGEILLPAL